MFYLYLTGLMVAGIIALSAYNFLDGRDLLRDLRDDARLTRRSLMDCDRHWAGNARQSDIIVCLTTIPSRIDHIDDTLKSLMLQTRRPQKIRLHTPVFSTREQRPCIVPQRFIDLQSVEVVHVEDSGPAAKLIPAVQQLAPDQNVLIVDDDNLYPDNMIEHFWGQKQTYPDIAIASSGWVVPADLTDRPTTLWRNIRHLPPAPVKATRIKKPYPVDILQGYSGYLVQPRFFDVEQLTNYADAPEAALFVDDVWISAHCRVPKWVLPAGRFCFTPRKNRRHFNRTGLGRLNRGNGDPEQRHNTIMIRYFRDRWMLASREKTQNPDGLEEAS